MYENIFPDLIERDLILVALLETGPKSQFSFKGKCLMSPIWGQIQVNGYSVRAANQNSPKWFEIYSPETNSFIAIKNSGPSSRKRKADQNDSMDPNRVEFTKTIADQLRQVLNSDISDEFEAKLTKFLAVNQFNHKSSSLFAIAPLKSQMCSYLSHFPNFQVVYQSKISPSENNIEMVSKLVKFGVYPVLNSNQIFNETDEFVNVVDDIMNENAYDRQKENSSNTHPPPTIMACGGKDVGKSTLLRFTINSLLNRFPKVAFIDCDPGQTEFTLGGCITLAFITTPLLGPPHTHISHSDPNKMCYFLGHLSPNDVPSLYLECLRQCLTDFESVKNSSNRHEKIPLVVNTMGWNQGLGLCLLKETILLFKPTHVIQINHPIEANKNMPVLDQSWLSAANGWPPVRRTGLESSNEDSSMSVDLPSYKLFPVKSAVPKSQNTGDDRTNKKRFSPRDHRNVAIIAYFSRLQDSNTFIPIHHLRPYRISWSKIGLHVSHMRIDFSQFLNVFNASLVGLCQCDPKFMKPWKGNLELPCLIDTADTETKNVLIKCFGFGIIRGINMESKEFYVLTPEPIEVLNQVNVLVKGMLNLPLEFFYEQDYQTPCPYMTFATTGSNRLGHVSNEPVQRKYLIHQSFASSAKRSAFQ